MTGPALSLPDLLARCETRDIRLISAEGGQLTVHASKDSLLADLPASLRWEQDRVTLQKLTHRRKERSHSPQMPFAGEDQRPGETYLSSTGSPFVEIAAVASGSLNSQFGKGMILDTTDSNGDTCHVRKKRTKRLTDQLRQAIDNSGLTRYRIAKETGISESTLSKFYLGQRGLSMEAMDALGEFLQLRIILGRKPDKKGK